jgi:hypothetical protein
MMEAVDGNAVGGLLRDVFGAELTNATGTCANCGAVAPVAETVVFLRGPGVVIRCRACDAVLVVIVEKRGVRCVDLQGLSGLRKEGAL